MNATGKKSHGVATIEWVLVVVLVGASVLSSVSVLSGSMKAHSETLASTFNEVATGASEEARHEEILSHDTGSVALTSPWLLPASLGIVVIGFLSIRRVGSVSTKQTIVDELQAIINGSCPFTSSATLSRKRESILNAMMLNAACHDRKSLTAGEVMSTGISYVLPDTSSSKVRKQMNSQGIHHSLVCGGTGLVGIISDRDLTNETARTAEDLMTPNPFTVTERSDVAEITQLMLQHRISCVPVVDGRKVVGVVTSTDISVTLQCILSLFGNLLWSGGKQPASVR